MSFINWATSPLQRWSSTALRSAIQMKLGVPVSGIPSGSAGACMYCRSYLDTRGHYLFRENEMRGAHATRHNLGCKSLAPYLRRWFGVCIHSRMVYTRLWYGVQTSPLRATMARRYVVDVFIVHLPIASTVTITNPSVIDAAA